MRIGSLSTSINVFRDDLPFDLPRCLSAYNSTPLKAGMTVSNGMPSSFLTMS